MLFLFSYRIHGRVQPFFLNYRDINNVYLIIYLNFMQKRNFLYNYLPHCYTSIHINQEN